MQRRQVMINSSFTSFYQISGREKLDAILFDVDGTLSFGGRALPGAERLLRMLEADRFPYLLLTNDSSNSCAEKAAILQRSGLPVGEERIFSAGNVLKYWADNEGYRGELFFQYGQLGKPSYPGLAGINVTTDPKRINQCYGVLGGEGNFNWQQGLEAVFNFFLSHPNAPFVIANPDSYWPNCTGDGMGIGAGSLARFVCTLLNDAGIKLEPTYLGKPYPMIYQCVMQALSKRFPYAAPLKPERIAMVGDSLASDIRGANLNGMLSCLVLTGITTAALAKTASPERKPAMIFEAV